MELFKVKGNRGKHLNENDVSAYGSYRPAHDIKISLFNIFDKRDHGGYYKPRDSRDGKGEREKPISVRQIVCHKQIKLRASEEAGGKDNGIWLFKP